MHDMECHYWYFLSLADQTHESLEMNTDSLNEMGAVFSKQLKSSIYAFYKTIYYDD